MSRHFTGNVARDAIVNERIRIEGERTRAQRRIRRSLRDGEIRDDDLRALTQHLTQLATLDAIEADEADEADDGGTPG